MKKPTPPPSASQPSTASSPEELAAKHQPIPSPLNFTQESPFIDPLDLPEFGAGLASSSICDGCANLWKMEIGGQVQNKKADGSEYTKVERYCIFKDNLVSLAERAVKNCTRFERKN